MSRFPRIVAIGYKLANETKLDLTSLILRVRIGNFINALNTKTIIFYSVYASDLRFTLGTYMEERSSDTVRTVGNYSATKVANVDRFLHQTGIFSSAVRVGLGIMGLEFGAHLKFFFTIIP